MDNIGVICVNTTKESAEKLAGFIGCNWTTLDSHGNNSSPYVHSINWGVSRVHGNVILNKPRAIRRSINKLRTFELLKDHVRLPTITEDKDEAREWVKNGRSVLCRDRVEGSRNQGIIITNKLSVFEEAPAKFYSRFIAGCSEYRINCWKGEIISVYKKLKSNNSFVFKIQLNMEPEDDVITMAYAVHEHLKLDMYGMDVLLSPKGKWFFLECNSGPVLFDITANRLSKRIKSFLETENENS